MASELAAPCPPPPPPPRGGHGYARKPQARTPGGKLVAGHTVMGVLVSRGSVNHFRGQCRPCWFQCVEGACSAGAQCNSCHFYHPEGPPPRKSGQAAERTPKRPMKIKGPAHGNYEGARAQGRPNPPEVVADSNVLAVSRAGFVGKLEVVEGDEMMRQALLRRAPGFSEVPAKIPEPEMAPLRHGLGAKGQASFPEMPAEPQAFLHRGPSSKSKAVFDAKHPEREANPWAGDGLWGGGPGGANDFEGARWAALEATRHHPRGPPKPPGLESPSADANVEQLTRAMTALGFGIGGHRDFTIDHLSV